MPLEFPNPSRSFDEARNAVRFIGHDGMFEVPFLIEADALTATGRKGLETAEAACLAAFDAARHSIHASARKLYSGGKRTIYTITAADMR
ncbi:DUF1488 family protein [Mesorhizobium sp.]|uniref:DUF1488 family protein n=1 Tax=Mesorhizobium sp. TaxID=1871066 RepID=UPI000FEA110A|nr:DUF1488 family protein [Mesorhizobium sp.]RWM06028.1 MAG: DUF1488 domain-containing protein [Mesorhizobium sp.]RWM24479.1 MAG: DUF1488 domain-containing protein [Mesorhizobium sp.]TIO51879.1 MAG: DUF1488 domain-containing protein [Mesorhizobium sp.]TIO58923.1 MAG: DUF1488 domain-containing protein [Mesorhizobium sp.]TJV60793.1 MAG: DUF1488 domain-containing protein [Mesorhizobium sp.]